jgi:predicted regulator of Ras-like GTPase activity (Roadblock/LC7/MglB family)
MSPVAKDKAEKKPVFEPLPQQIGKTLCARIGVTLKSFVKTLESVGVNGAVVATLDGFEIAVAAVSSEEGKKLAAMSSSISAIGDMVVMEVNAGSHHRSITIESDNGYIFFVTVPHPECRMILSVIASKEAMLGKLFYYAKQVVEKMCAA